MGLKSIKFPKFVTPAVPKAYMKELEDRMVSFRDALKENKRRGPMEATFSLFNSNLKRPKFEKDKSKLLGFKITTGDKIAKSSEEQIEALTKAFTNAYAIVNYGYVHYKGCVGHEIIAKYFDELDKERKSLMKREKLNVGKLYAGAVNMAESEKVEWNKYKFYAKYGKEGVNELLKFLNIKPTTPYYVACEEIYSWCLNNFALRMEEYSKIKKNIDKHIKEAEEKLAPKISDFQRISSSIRSAVQTVYEGKIQFDRYIDELCEKDKKLAEAISNEIKKEGIEIKKLEKDMEKLRKKSGDIKLSLISSLLSAKGDRGNDEILTNVSNYFVTYCNNVKEFLSNLSMWYSADILLKSLKRVVDSTKTLSDSLDTMAKVNGTRGIASRKRAVSVEEIKNLASKLTQKNDEIESGLDSVQEKFEKASHKIQNAISAYKKEKNERTRRSLAVAAVAVLSVLTLNVGSVISLLDNATYNVATGV